MKFNREHLIKTLDTMIEGVFEQTQADFRKADADWSEARDKWLVSEHPGYFLDEMAALIERIGSGETITYDDLSAFNISYGGKARGHTFDSTRPVYRDPDVSRLVKFRDFLKTVTDDEVSSSGLRDVGFRNISDILQASR